VAEIPAAVIDERTIVVAEIAGREASRTAAIKVLSSVRVEAVIMVHLITSIYINGYEVDVRLGANVEAHARSIILMYSQYEPIYTCGYPNPSRSSKR
jgi:hypothetical protein